jgi:hypothetical protein
MSPVIHESRPLATLGLWAFIALVVCSVMKMYFDSSWLRLIVVWLVVTVVGTVGTLWKQQQDW